MRTSETRLTAHISHWFPPIHQAKRHFNKSPLWLSGRRSSQTEQAKGVTRLEKAQVRTQETGPRHPPAGTPETAGHGTHIFGGPGSSVIRQVPRRSQRLRASSTCDQLLSAHRSSADTTSPRERPRSVS